MSKNHEDEGPSWVGVIIMLCIFWPVGLYLLWKKLKHSAKYIERKRREKQEKLANRYLAVIGGSATMSVDSIASAMGVDYDTACKDMQDLMYEGYFPRTAYVDLGRGLYILDRRYAPEDGAKSARPAAQRPAQKKQEAKAPADKVKACASAVKNAPSITKEEAEYVEKLLQIRAVNDAIKDEKVSSQIERIEHITGNIFEQVVEQPQKKASIHTFMNYYLPTTLKLLTAYSKLEKQKVSGDNIDASKKNIEKLLDQLVWAFERQNDQMFAGDALDISSDVKVMETMMAKDGLSEGGLPKDPFKVARQGG